jgi:RNA polymerase sigma-70 factor (ECF subfamily)
LDDEQLMLDYAAGDLRAFELLFVRWAPRLHAFFRRSFGSRVDADDLLQLTFMRVHRARRRFQAQWPLRAWLFAIAARLRQDEFRRRRRSANAEEEALAGEEEAQLPMDGETELERAALVQAVLEDLPESQRTVIHLHRFERMTFAEIARVLGTTEGAVKLRAFRAYRRLRALLTPLLARDDAVAWLAPRLAQRAGAPIQT